MSNEPTNNKEPKPLDWGGIRQEVIARLGKPYSCLHCGSTKVHVGPECMDAACVECRECGCRSASIKMSEAEYQGLFAENRTFEEAEKEMWIRLMVEATNNWNHRPVERKLVQ